MEPTIEYLPILGETLISVEKTNGGRNGDQITFKTATKTWIMYHSQDCCENVYIDDIEGNLSDLVGEPLLQAEVVTGEPDGSESRYDELQQWTFYKLATIKGYVTIRWYGGSNGWYSVSVSFEEPNVWNLS